MKNTLGSTTEQLRKEWETHLATFKSMARCRTTCLRANILDPRGIELQRRAHDALQLLEWHVWDQTIAALNTLQEHCHDMTAQHATANEQFEARVEARAASLQHVLAKHAQQLLTWHAGK